MIRNDKNSSVLVLMSGGVDSSVTAFSLLESGYHVEGLFLDILPENCDQKGAERVEEICRFLGIKLHVLEKRELFKNNVIDYFVKTYSEGLTPNPCVVCNPKIKIHLGLSLANSLGIQNIATGHYARISKTKGLGTILRKGIDPVKDQSYFLHQLPAESLKHLLLPLGDKNKAEVREIAREKGLFPLIQEESQEVCFLTGDYRDFLLRHGIDKNIPGEVVDTKGNVLGRHKGLHRYTIGQRRGLGIPDSTPFYVISMDRIKNRLIIGKETDLLRSRCFVKNINWLVKAGHYLNKQVDVKIRYRHPGVSAVLRRHRDNGIEVIFSQPQRAVTPGQFCVFYLDDIVLGGGEICG